MIPPPRVSVAMPVRNAAPWLEACLDSVAAQGEPSFELLVVDDGSTDASVALAEARAAGDPRIRLLRTEAGSRGIVAALNLALTEARAPLLARMDADDVMHPERLARQAGALDDDPSLFAVASRAAAFPEADLRDGMRAYLDWQNGLLAPEELARDRFIESPVLHPSVMMRSEVARQHLGGWRDAAWPEDWDFFLRAFEKGLRIRRLPETLVKWRLHPGQLTRTHARYSEGALLAARAHFLVRHLVPHLVPHPVPHPVPDPGDHAGAKGREVWVLGAGPVGKTLVKALALAGLTAAGLADVDPRKIGGVVRGAGHRWPVVAHDGLRALVPRPFAISAVSGADARRRVRGELDGWGWKEGEDYLVAA